MPETVDRDLIYVYYKSQYHKDISGFFCSYFVFLFCNPIFIRTEAQEAQKSYPRLHKVVGLHLKQVCLFINPKSFFLVVVAA